MNWIMTAVFGERCPRCGRRQHARARLFHDQVHQALDSGLALQRRCQEALRKP